MSLQEDIEKAFENQQQRISGVEKQLELKFQESVKPFKNIFQSSSIPEKRRVIATVVQGLVDLWEILGCFRILNEIGEMELKLFSEIVVAVQKKELDLSEEEIEELRKLLPQMQQPMLEVLQDRNATYYQKREEFQQVTAKVISWITDR